MAIDISMVLGGENNVQYNGKDYYSVVIGANDMVGNNKVGTLHKRSSNVNDLNFNDIDSTSYSFSLMDTDNFPSHASSTRNITFSDYYCTKTFKCYVYTGNYSRMNALKNNSDYYDRWTIGSQPPVTSGSYTIMFVPLDYLNLILDEYSKNKFGIDDIKTYNQRITQIDNEYNAKKQQYDTDLVAYNQYLQDKQAYDEYLQEKQAYYNYVQQKQSYEENKQKYEEYLTKKSEYDEYMVKKSAYDKYITDLQIYNSVMDTYNKKLEQYNKDMEQYKKDLEEYNKTHNKRN